MKRLLIENNRKFLVMTFCLLTISCGNSNDNYPQDYVGFKYALRKILIGCNQTEFETEFKIIAAQKTDYTRTVVLTTPGSSLGEVSALQLLEKEVTLKAGEKTASIKVKIFPKRMIAAKQNIQISCIPQWKEGEISKLSVQLKKVSHQ